MERERNLLKKEKTEIIHLYHENFNLMDIAKHYEKNFSTIHRLVKKLNLRRKTIEESLKNFYEC